MSIKGIQCIGEMVLIDPDKEDGESEGGIILPDVRRTQICRGTAIGVGIGRYLKSGTLIPMQVKVGDKVLFGAMKQSDIVYEGKEYIAVPESEILGIVRGE